jgi:hypothetical protein
MTRSCEGNGREVGPGENDGSVMICFPPSATRVGALTMVCFWTSSQIASAITHEHAARAVATEVTWESTMSS